MDLIDISAEWGVVTPAEKAAAISKGITGAVEALARLKIHLHHLKQAKKAKHKLALLEKILAEESAYAEALADLTLAGRRINETKPLTRVPLMMDGKEVGEVDSAAAMEMFSGRPANISVGYRPSGEITS